MKRDLNLALLLAGLLAAAAVYLGTHGSQCLRDLSKLFAQMRPATTTPAANRRPSEQFPDLIDGLKKKVDSQNKGYITKNDIDAAILTDHSIKGDEAAALFALRQVFDLVSKQERTGERRYGTKEAAILRTAMPAQTAQLIDGYMTHALTFLPSVNRGLYPSGTAQQSQAKMVAIQQLNRGNCYFESGFGSLAAIDPQKIRDMIRDEGVGKNGVRTFSVRFARAPLERYSVEELTDVALLINDIDNDSGVWLAVLVRAYGMYQVKHPEIRAAQRWLFGLNKSILPEDITDHGSMSSDGLRMCTPDNTRIKQNVFVDGIDSALIKRDASDALVSTLRQAIQALEQVDQKELTSEQRNQLEQALKILKAIDENSLRGPVAAFVATIIQSWLKAFLYCPRDEAMVHKQLKHSVCDEHLPATVFKSGGAHEASITNYKPGTVTADGKHTSKYGFITIHDQAGLSAEEIALLTTGQCWREQGMDDQTICMTVEHFTSYYTGFASAIRKP